MLSLRAIPLLEFPACKYPILISSVGHSKKDVGALPETAFKITQKIYNDLLKYDFSAPGDIFQRTNEILSISYIVYDGAQASTRFDIQFNLTQIDRTKSFAENLTLKQLIRYPSIP